MERSIVADDVNASEATQSSAQIVKMFEEQLAVPTPSGCAHQ
jgi:hypothetical protein